MSGAAKKTVHAAAGTAPAPNTIYVRGEKCRRSGQTTAQTAILAVAPAAFNVEESFQPSALSFQEEMGSGKPNYGSRSLTRALWIPAFAGMTVDENSRFRLLTLDS
jgi:hypothetical protein